MSFTHRLRPTVGSSPSRRSCSLPYHLLRRPSKVSADLRLVTHVPGSASGVMTETKVTSRRQSTVVGQTVQSPTPTDGRVGHITMNLGVQDPVHSSPLSFTFWWGCGWSSVCACRSPPPEREGGPPGTSGPRGGRSTGHDEEEK